jgi:hypothetical protein
MEMSSQPHTMAALETRMSTHLKNYDFTSHHAHMILVLPVAKNCIKKSLRGQNSEKAKMQ